MRFFLPIFVLILITCSAMSQGTQVIRTPLTTNNMMNAPQDFWIPIWNNVAKKWSNGVNTASATNNAQPPSTVLSNLTATGVAPGATNASAYIGSSTGRGTNTSLMNNLQFGNGDNAGTTTISNVARFRWQTHMHDQLFMDALTGDRLLYVDPGQVVQSLANVSSTEAGFLDGVTSGIQAQIDAISSGGPFNITQFDASGSVTNIRSGAQVTNLSSLNLTNRGVLVQQGPQTNRSGIYMDNTVSGGSANLFLQAENNESVIGLFSTYGSGIPSLSLRHYNGTPAARLPTLSGETLGFLIMDGFMSGTEFGGLVIESKAKNDWIAPDASAIVNFNVGDNSGSIGGKTVASWTAYGMTNDAHIYAKSNLVVSGLGDFLANVNVGMTLTVVGQSTLIGLINSFAGFTPGSTNVIHSLSEDATPANGDFVMVEDLSAGLLKKVQLSNLPGGGSGGGGTTNAFTGGILWVDQTNGNDALAIATGGRDFMHPWATFTNALRYATNGDTVKVGPGRWNITNGIAAIMPVGVHLQGSGRRSSFITNSLVLNALTAGQGVGIALATDSMVSGFYLAIDAHTNQYRAQIGAVFLTALGLTHNRAFTNAVISDCEIEGGTDAVFVRHDSVCTLRIYNCTIRGKSDVLVFGDNAGSSIEIYNVDSRAIGPYALYPQTDGFIFLAASAIIENSSSYVSNNVNWNKAMDLRSGAHVIVRNSKFLAGGTNPTNIFGEAGTLLELQTEDGYDTNRVFGPVVIDRKTFIEASTTTSGVPVTNRFTSDYIGSSSATAIGLGTSNTFRWVVDADGQMYPFVDGIKAIGRDANRVKAIHTVTSVVNQIKMVNGQAANSVLGLNSSTNVVPLILSGLTYHTSGNVLSNNASAGGGGPGTLPMNANQFDTNNPVSIKNGALLTNISVRAGLALPTLTASRAAVIDASGNLTNVASSSPSTEFVRADGTAAVPSGSGSTNNVAQGIGTSDTTNAVKRHWVYFNGDTNVVVDWTKTNYYIVSPSNTFTVSWANAPSAGGLAQSVRLTVINTNSTSGFFPTNGLNGSPVIMLSAPSTNTYLFNFDGTNFWTDSGQILTTGLGDTNVFNVSPTIHSPILPTGASSNRAPTRSFALVLTNANGMNEWSPVVPALRSRRRSWLLPTSTTIGSCGHGEQWSLQAGSVSFTEASSALPSALFWNAPATIGNSNSVNGNGFKFWQTGRGSGINWTGGNYLPSTNAMRFWFGLTSGTAAQLNGSQPNFRFAAFRYDSETEGTYRFVTANAGSAWTTNNTGVPVVINQHRHFEIVEDVANATWYGVIDGVTVATNTSNLPSGNMQSMVHIATLEAVSKTNYVSYIEVTGNY